MSQHVIVQGPTKVYGETEKDISWEDIKWVFGWDPPLRSFYLQKHDALVENPDENPVLWLGSNANNQLVDIEDLMEAAQKLGCEIDFDTKMFLILEQHDNI